MPKIRFYDIPDRIKYPANCQAKLTDLHNEIIQYTSDNFSSKVSFKRSVIKAMNTVSYLLISGDTIPSGWKPQNLTSGLPDISEDSLKSKLKNSYILQTSIDWSELVESDNDSIDPSIDEINESVRLDSEMSFNQIEHSEQFAAVSHSEPEDLYLQGPLIPQIDTSKIYASGEIDGTKLVIYHSLPIVPTRQCEISVTTDVSLLSERDLMKLYPDRRFYTRNSDLYRKVDGLYYEEGLGCVLPIKDFSRSQIIDNMIKYPHLENILRLGKSASGAKYVEFWKFIEIGGELHRTKDIWDSLPESSFIPKSKFFMEEYVIRRYLLERDVEGINHRFKMFGSLDPFLTLFMDSDSYIRYGYKNVVEIARQCVCSRVSYKKSRNPILRRLGELD